MSDSPTARSVFGELIELPASERPEALDRLCAGNDELRREVGSLLQAHGYGSDLIPTAPMAQGLVPADPELVNVIGDLAEQMAAERR